MGGKLGKCGIKNWRKKRRWIGILIQFVTFVQMWGEVGGRFGKSHSSPPSYYPMGRSTHDSKFLHFSPQDSQSSSNFTDSQFPDFDFSSDEDSYSSADASSSVPVVPIQLPAPNQSVHYHYADDFSKVRFKTDFSKILLPFKGTRKDLENPENYRDNYEDEDQMSEYSEKVETSFQHEFDSFKKSFESKSKAKRKKLQQQKKKKPELTFHNQTRKLGIKFDDYPDFQDFPEFESKKIQNKKLSKSKTNKNTIPGSSLEELSLSLNYDNGDDEKGRSDDNEKSLVRRRPRRSVVHLYDMVVCATGCNPLAYKGYGCYCGFLGSGLTVDGIDRCCAKHDWCYHHAKCPPFLTYFVPYYWTCNDGRPRCVTEYRGWKGVCGANLCECDRQFAECLRKFPCPRSRAMCMTSPWRLWQNLLMFPRYSTSSYRVHTHHY